MSKLNELRKAFGLIALLCCGAWTANAGISLLGDTCISAGSSTNYTYSIEKDADVADFTVVSSVWSVEGGIENRGETLETVTIESGKLTDYNSSYSKYAKGRIKVKAVLEKREATTHNCCGVEFDSWSIERRELLAEIDIRKEFDIFNETIKNKIIGPECVSEGEEVTYSIAPWITMMEPDKVGYDIYDWFPDGIPSFVQNSILYYSADKSSITFTVGQLTGNEIISVQVGFCNAPDNVLTLPLRSAIPPPVIVPSSCIPGGVHNVTFQIQGYINDVEYTWSSDNWTRRSPTNKGTSMEYQTDLTGAANIRVEANYTNGGTCQSVFSITQVTRSFGASSKIVSESGSDCLEADVPVTFTIQNAPTPATFDWNYDELTDWAFAGYEATDDGGVITLTPGINAVSGGKLRATLNGCDNSFREFDFNIKPGDAIDIENETTNGLFCLTKNQLYTFSTTSVTPAPNSYKWDLGNGWELSDGSAASTVYGQTITVRPVGNVIADSIRVTPMGLKGCNGKTFAQAVSYPPTAPQGINVPDPTSCINSGMADNITLSVIGGSTNQKYTWTLNGLGTITNNTTSPSIDVATSGIDDVYTVSVSAYTNNDVCPQSAPVSDIVTIAGVDFTVIEHVLTATESFYEMTPNGWSNRHYSILWELDGINETFSENSRETNEIYPGLLEPTSPYDFRVTVTKNADQCKTVRSWGANATVQNNSLHSFSLQSVFQNPRNSKVSSLRTLQVGNNATMTISPNPANGLVDIAFSNTGNADIQIRDMAGRIVKILSSTTQNVTVDISNLVSGSYVVLATQNGKNFKEILIVK